MYIVQFLSSINVTTELSPQNYFQTKFEKDV